jgi:hypothetical protein
VSTAPKPTPPAENGLRISTETAVRVVGRPPTPPPDPRVETAKTWSTAARLAAKSAFEAALAGGASREEAIEAGHAAGLRGNLEEKGLEPSGIDLVTRAASIFGGTVYRVLPADRDRTRLEDRCFERLFPDRGIPMPAEPASPTRSRDRDDEDSEEAAAKEAARRALAGGLARKPAGGQKTLDFGA